MTVMAWVLVLTAVGTLPAVVLGLLPPAPRRQRDVVPQAVVVLGAGRTRWGGHWRLPPAGLRRLAVGAERAAQAALPMLLCGGRKRRLGPTESALMGTLLERRWPQQQAWLEQRSRNTWENARYGAQELRLRGIDSILLVTSRAHQARAALSFRAQGLRVEVVSADDSLGPAWMPSVGALALLPDIYYEWMALVFYRLRYL